MMGYIMIRHIFISTLVGTILLATAAISAVVSEDTFIKKASEANLFEIQSSELAVITSKNKEIIDFAHKTIKDHKKIADDMKSAIQTSGLSHEVAKIPNQEQQSDIDELKTTKEKEFDKEYIKMQRKAHDDAVALFSNYSESGKDTGLVNFARNSLPILKEHQDHLQKIDVK
jgi:putative membrane protein